MTGSQTKHEGHLLKILGYGFGLADRRMCGIAEMPVADRPIPRRADVGMRTAGIGSRHSMKAFEAFG